MSKEPILRCPPFARHETDIVGCGSTNISERPDEEGLYDCGDCGIWFTADEARVTFNKLMGVAAPEIGALAKMRKRGGRWAAYQNHELGHPGLGHLQFLQYGKGCTYVGLPKTYPMDKDALGWRYLLVGLVNIEAGLIEIGFDEEDARECDTPGNL